MSRTVHCVKLQREAEGLAFAPWPGELGRRIYEQVSRQAWQDWLKHQTLLLNEKRVVLTDPATAKYLAEQREKFLDGEAVDRAEGYVPPKA